MKNWNDITVGQWQHIMRVCENEPEELLRWLEILPVLEPITKDQIRELGMKKYGRLVKKWKGIFETQPDNRLHESWEYGGRKMVCKHDIRELKAGPFVDGQEIRSKRDHIDSYHEFLAIWWHDEGKGYDPQNFEERALFIQKHMPAGVGGPTANFFFQLWMESLPAIHDYLKGEAAKAIGLPLNGTGTPVSIG